MEENTSFRTAAAGFVALAKSGDNGLIEPFEENCRKLFSHARDENNKDNKNIPGLCLLSLIVDPKTNDSSLMHCILKHYLTENRQLNSPESVTDFKSNFDSDLEDLKEKNSNCPMLIAWREPLWVTKRASDYYPVYILEIIGNFPEGFMDPNYIALAGLSMWMSATVVTVTDSSLEERSMRFFMPMAVQGMRSAKKVMQFQQLHIIIMEAESGPYGAASGRDDLAQFWSQTVDDNDLSRLRTVFKTFHCHKIPKHGNTWLKTLFTKSLDHILDATLTPKIFLPGGPLQGDDVVELMMNHVDEVTDADYEDHLQNFIAAGMLTLTQCSENDAASTQWRDSNKTETDFKPELENDYSDNTADSEEELSAAGIGNNYDLVPAEDVNPIPQTDEDMDSLAQSIGQLNITQVPPKTDGEIAQKKSKFSERFKNKMTQDLRYSTPPEAECLPEQPGSSEPETQVVDISQQSMDDPFTITSNSNTEITSCQKISDDLVQRTGCLQKSIEDPSKFPDEIIVNPRKTLASSPKSRQVVEIERISVSPLVPNVATEKTYDTTRDMIHGHVIQVFNSKSADSVVTAIEIVEEAFSKIPKINLDCPSSFLDACRKDVTKKVENLMLTILKFQDDVEADFNSMTEESLNATREVAVLNYKPECYATTLDKKLNGLVKAYKKIKDDNNLVLKTKKEESINQLCEIFSKDVVKHFEEAEPTEATKDTVKVAAIKKMITPLNKVFTNFLSLQEMEELEEILRGRLEIVYTTELKKIEAKWAEAESARKIAIDKYSSQFQKSIEKAREVALTVGGLDEANSQLQADLVQVFVREFGKNDKGCEQLTLAMGIIFKKVRSEFNNSMSKTAFSSTKFVAPSKALINIGLSGVHNSRTVNIPVMSLGIHFGLRKLAASFWDSNNSSSLLTPIDNVVSFSSNDFKLKREHTSVEVGNLFVEQIELRLWPKEVILSSIPLMAVVMKILKRKAESQLEKKVSNLVVAIPSFIDLEKQECIVKLGSFINIDKITLITETDAVAIQWLGKLGLSDTDVRDELSTSILVVVVRRNSYDIASYVIETGRIVRKGLTSVKIKRGMKAYVKSYFIDELINSTKSVISTFPKWFERNFKTVLLSDLRDLVTDEFRRKIKALVPIAPGHEQLLSVCVAKGSSLLAAFEAENNEGALKYWKTLHPDFNMSFTAPLLVTKESINEGQINTWPPPMNDVAITKQTTLALEIMQQKCMPFKIEFENYLLNKIEEVGSLENISEYIRKTMMSILQENLDLLASLNVGETYCKKRRESVEKELHKLENN